jgi:predicted RecA/RadA family phage recombinase
MKNFVQPGATITVVAPAGGVVAGKLYAVGKIVGVAAYDAAAGANAELSVEGVYDLAKLPADTITQGQQAKATAAGVIDGTGTIVVGYAVAAAGAGTATARVRLVPSAV